LKHVIITVLVILAIIVPTYFVAQWLFANHPISLMPVKEAPIPNDPDARIQQDYFGEKYRWMRRLTVDAYHSAHTDASDGNVGALFLDRICKAYAYQAEPDDFILLEKQGEAVIAAGNNDPLILVWFGAVLFENGKSGQAVPYLEVADKWDQNTYPRIHAFFAYGFMADIFLDKKDAQPETTKESILKARNYFVQALRKNEFHFDESHIAYRLLSALDHNADGTDIFGPVLATIEKDNHIDTWLRDIIRGCNHIDRAWEARGSGWSKDVTKEGWKGFKQHLGIAREALTPCWSSRQERPEAAALMITVTMAGHGNMGDTERLWFDRAVKAQMDYAPAYFKYGYAISPNWGGSNHKRKVFAKECLNTGRFDTDVPLYYLFMNRKIAAEQKGNRWRTVFRRGSVHDDIRHLFKGLMEEPDRSHQRSRIQTQWALVEAWCGDHEKAKTLLDGLDIRINVKKGFWGKALSWSTRDWETVEAEIEAFTGPYRDTLTEAELLIDAGKVDQAVDILKSVMALEHNNSSVFNFLRDRVALLQMGTQGKNESYPVISLAAKGGHLDVVRFLVENDADINAKNRYHSTPLYLAVIRKHDEVAKYLIRQGANTNLRGYGLRTPLHVALEKKQHELAMLLIENGAEIDARTYWGWSNLHYALYYHDTEIAKTLIRAGADVNAATASKWTPLHYCAFYGYTDVAAMLLERGADHQGKVIDGRTPLMMAQQRNMKGVETLLRR
jgi:hypothetical protein